MDARTLAGSRLGRAPQRRHRRARALRRDDRPCCSSRQRRSRRSRLGRQRGRHGRSSSSSRAGSRRRNVGPDPRPQHTLVLVSTDAGAFGGAGAARFADDSPLARGAIAVVVLDGLGGAAARAWRSRATTRCLRRARSSGPRPPASSEEIGVSPALPSVAAQLVDLGIPFALDEQGRFLARGLPAVTLTTDPDDARRRRQRRRGSTPSGSGSSAERREALLGSLDASVGAASARPTASSSATARRADGRAACRSSLAVVPFALGVVDLIVARAPPCAPVQACAARAAARLGVWALRRAFSCALGAFAGDPADGRPAPAGAVLSVLRRPPSSVSSFCSSHVRPRLARRATHLVPRGACDARRAARRAPSSRCTTLGRRRARARRASALRARLRAAVALRVALAPARRAAVAYASSSSRAACSVRSSDSSAARSTSSACPCSTRSLYVIGLVHGRLPAAELGAPRHRLGRRRNPGRRARRSDATRHSGAGWSRRLRARSRRLRARLALVEREEADEAARLELAVAARHVDERVRRGRADDHVRLLPDDRLEHDTRRVVDRATARTNSSRCGLRRNAVDVTPAHVARRRRSDRALEREERGRHEDERPDERRDRVPGKPEDERAAADAEGERLPGLDRDAPEDLLDAELGSDRAARGRAAPTETPPDVTSTSALETARDRARDARLRRPRRRAARRPRRPRARERRRRASRRSTRRSDRRRAARPAAGARCPVATIATRGRVRAGDLADTRRGQRTDLRGAETRAGGDARPSPARDVAAARTHVLAGATALADRRRCRRVVDVLDRDDRVGALRHGRLPSRSPSPRPAGARPAAGPLPRRGRRSAARQACRPRARRSRPSPSSGTAAGRPARSRARASTRPRRAPTRHAPRAESGRARGCARAPRRSSAGRPRAASATGAWGGGGRFVARLRVDGRRGLRVDVSGVGVTPESGRSPARTHHA